MPVLDEPAEIDAALAALAPLPAARHQLIVVDGGSRDGTFAATFSEASGDALERCYIWSIMTWPKPEQETWVAPSSRRAKS